MSEAPAASFPTLRVRPATAGDLPSVLDVEAASFSTPWSRGTFETLLRRDAVVFRVLEVVAGQGAGAGVVGHGVLWVVGPEAEIANVAVLPGLRGQGAGALLLDTLLAEAGIRGAETVFLEVRASNASARRLYASRGFQEIGVRRRYYRAPVEDARVLALDLVGDPAGEDPDPGNI